jgi:hypothetical protein
MAKFLSAFLLAWISLALPVVQAETFHDPLRPLASALTTQTADAVRAVEAPLVLQSVLLSSQRKLAVISGQQLSVGQSIRGYKLHSLTSRQAELIGPQGRLVLWLVPALNADSVPPVLKVAPQQGDKK